VTDFYNKLTKGQYNGETAKDVDFDEFVGHLILEDTELEALRVDWYSDGNGGPPSFEVYSSAWWEQYGNQTKRWGGSEIYVTISVSVVVHDKEETKVARVESRYQLCYYSIIPMDDETFVSFSETRVMDDTWPDVKRLVNEMLVRFDLDDYLIPEPASTGPVRHIVRT